MSLECEAFNEIRAGMVWTGNWCAKEKDHFIVEDRQFHETRSRFLEFHQTKKKNWIQTNLKGFIESTKFTLLFYFSLHIQSGEEGDDKPQHF